MLRLMNLIADIDECELANGGCSMTCRNTIGSYECACYSGFKLMPNNHTCESKSQENLSYFSTDRSVFSTDIVKDILILSKK